MEEKNVIILDGKEIELPKPATAEEMDDLLLLDEDMPTKDLEGLLENTKEIDWSQNE